MFAHVQSVSYKNVTDKWMRKVIENSLEWIQKKNLNILFAFLLMILYFIEDNRNTLIS